MIRNFGIFRKIELTEEQNNHLNSFVKKALKLDTNHQILAIVFSMKDVTNNILNDNINLHIMMQEFDYDFYESLKEKTSLGFEINDMTEFLPKNFVTVWRK